MKLVTTNARMAMWRNRSMLREMKRTNPCPLRLAMFREERDQYLNSARKWKKYFDQVMASRTA